MDAIARYSSLLQIGNARMPVQGSSAATIILDFTGASSLSLNFRSAYDSGAFDFIQCVFIDNSQNPNAFTLICTRTGQEGFRIIAEPNSQGIYPITMHPQDGELVGETTIGVEIPLVFYNCPMPIGTWGPISATATFATPQGTFTDRSGVVAAGATSQTLMAVNAARKRFIIENPVSAASQGIVTAESLFVNFTVNAGVNDGISFEISPGGSFDSGAGPVSTEKITVTATTTNHKYIAKEM